MLSSLMKEAGSFKQPAHASGAVWYGTLYNINSRSCLRQCTDVDNIYMVFTIKKIKSAIT